MSVRAIVPAQILRRWDAQALEQLCERLLEDLRNAVKPEGASLSVVRPARQEDADD